MNSKPNWSLLAKYLSGECDDLETAEVNRWLKGDERNKNILESYKRIWSTKVPEFEVSDQKEIWLKISEKISARDIQDEKSPEIFNIDKKRSSGRKVFNFVQYPVLRYAAVFLLVFSIVSLYYLFRESDIFSNRDKWETVTVGNGQQQNITLSDGTKIILDSGSQLQYPETFTSDSREIKLSGEAYLEVTHNENKPFKVIAGNAIIEVLGTKFNIRNWSESEKVEVAVVEGRVALEDVQNIDNKIMLDKGYVGSISNTGEFNKNDIVDIYSYISWMQGKISFHDASLAEVLKQIERWYNVGFSIQDTTIANERLTIFIRKNSLNEVLDLLTTLTNTNAQVNGNVINLSPKRAVRL